MPPKQHKGNPGAFGRSGEPSSGLRRAPVAQSVPQRLVEKNHLQGFAREKVLARKYTKPDRKNLNQRRDLFQGVTAASGPPKAVLHVLDAIKRFFMQSGIHNVDQLQREPFVKFLQRKPEQMKSKQDPWSLVDWLQRRGRTLDASAAAGLEAKSDPSAFGDMLENAEDFDQWASVLNAAHKSYRNDENPLDLDFATAQATWSTATKSSSPSKSSN